MGMWLLVRVRLRQIVHNLEEIDVSVNVVGRVYDVAMLGLSV